MSNWDINERNLRRVYDYCIRRGIQIDSSFHDASISSINSCLMKIKHQKAISKEQFDSCVNMVVRDCKVCLISNQTKTEVEVSLKSFENETQISLLCGLKTSIRRLKGLLIQIKNDVLSKKFNCYCLELEKNRCNWNLTSFIHRGSGKSVYSIGDGFNYLACRILQENLKEKYGINIGNRIRIIKQLKCLLNDDLPKAIIRTDIKNFFESINAKELIKEMDNKGLVQKSQINSLSSLIDYYNTISGSSKGVPRGVGISSYLAELYMQEIDNEIRRNSTVVYYARFVDDIVIITSEKESGGSDNALLLFDLLKNNLKEKGLEVHGSGEKYTICPSDCYLNFSYLGYRFTRSNGKLVVDISAEKVEKLKTKIKLAFVSFYNDKHDYMKAPYNKKLLDLKERLECISRPVHVKGMYKRIEIGTPITYSEITQNNSLKALDNYLQSYFQQTNNHDLINMLVGISFENGFSNPIAKEISSKKYKNLSKIWAHL